jgi:hypothetical protein
LFAFTTNTTLACDKVTRQKAVTHDRRPGFVGKILLSRRAHAWMIGVNLEHVAGINVFVHSLFLKGV